MTQQLPITVIIPIYNAEDYLETCLSSIAAQSNVDFEVICINDGSTDDSLSILKHFGSRDSRFQIIDKPNEGYGATVNRGLDMAQGRYISIIEPDDYLCGSLHEELYERAENENYPDIVKSAYWSVSEKGERTKLRCGFWGRIKPNDQPFRIEDAPLLMRYHPSIWSCLYRKDFLDTHGIRFHIAPGGGWVDNPFMVETYLKATRIIYTDQAFYCYRDDREGSSSTMIADLHIPIDRWNEMDAIIDKSDIDDETILGIHTYRGFYCLDAAKRAKNFEESTWIEAARKSLLRMNPAIVSRSRFISPENRHLYTTLTGCDLPKAFKSAYYLMLIEEVYWKIRQNGIVFLFRRLIRKP